MFVKNTLIFFVATIILFCKSSIVDNLQKCSIADTKCMTNVIKSVIHDSSKTGIPECDIPPFDPYVVRNEHVSVLNIVDVTMTEGVVKGIRNCDVKFDVNFNTSHAWTDITCNIKIKGKYKAIGEAEIIKTLLGGKTVHGNGNCKIVIEKFRLKTDYRFYVRNRSGDLYIDYNKKDAKIHNMNIGKITFAADNVYLGDTEASAFITDFMNTNWKFVMDNAGKPFLDRVSELIYSEIRKFFQKVPTKYFLADDLSPYVVD